MTVIPGERLTYTISEAATLLGVSRGVAYEAARTGELPTIKLGRRLLVPRARLLELLGEPSNGNGSAVTEPIAQPGAAGNGQE
jgi:excisionase family DNA binding protein